MSSGGLAGLATQRLNEVVYCSRFFDLNDEVEQELAAEDDFLSINISASQQENYEDQRKQFKVSSAIEQTAKSSSHSSSLAPQSQSLEFAPQIQAHTPGTKVQIFKSNSKRRTDFEKENVSSEPVARSSNRDQCLPTTFVSEDQKGFMVSIQKKSLFKHWSLNLCQIPTSLQGQLEWKAYVNKSQKMMVCV